MIDTIKHYRNMEEAKGFTSRRSFNAFNRGEYSQYEVRYKAEIFVGGPVCDLLKSQFADAEIIAQYSGGYRCD